jgi:hypothetical protein
VPPIGFLAVLGVHVSVGLVATYLRVSSISAVSHMVLLCCLAIVLVDVVARLHVSNVSSLSMLEKRLGVSAGGARAGLGAQLSGAVSEHDVLRVASEALHGLFPGATAHAVATLSEANAGLVAFLEVAAVEESERAALHNALPLKVPLPRGLDVDATLDGGAGVGASSDDDDDDEASSTSVAFVCGHPAERGAVVADSTDWPEGVHAFADWASAERNGCTGGQFVTARLISGGATVGFIVLHFRSAARGFAFGNQAAPDILRDVCEAVADAVLARRAKDAMESSARLSRERERAAISLSSLAGDVFPQHLVAVRLWLALCAVCCAVLPCVVRCARWCVLRALSSALLTTRMHLHPRRWRRACDGVRRWWAASPPGRCAAPSTPAAPPTPAAAAAWLRTTLRQIC